MTNVRILRDPGSAEGGAAGAPDVVTIPRAELEALRRAAAGPPEDAPGEALLREVADRERRLSEREAAYRSAIRDRELAVALAGRPLVPGAATQLLKLWRDEFDVFEDEGRCRVACRDGRAVAQAVADWLSSPEYAHFCPPPSRGGTVTPGASRPSPAATAGAPATLGEAILRRWQESSARPDPAAGPVGLGRRR